MDSVNLREARMLFFSPWEYTVVKEQKKKKKMGGCVHTSVCREKEREKEQLRKGLNRQLLSQ